MALSFPAAADTPRKKLAFCNRAWKLLHLWRENRRLALSNDDFVVWQRDVWRPKLTRLARIRAAIIAWAIANLAGTTEENAETVSSFKRPDAIATDWDKDINTESI